MARCTHWIRPLLACLALCAPAAPLAESADQSSREVLTLDPARSLAEFEVRVMWLIPVRGHFGTLQGMITIDRFHGSASVDASIDVNDVHMRSTGNEAWVKSDEFFDATHYPQIHFVSYPFSLARLKNGGWIEGALTIRGVSAHARFELAASECPAAVAHACPVKTTGTIRRSDFGMRSRRGALSDKVQLDFSVYVLPGTDASR